MMPRNARSLLIRAVPPVVLCSFLYWCMYAESAARSSVLAQESFQKGNQLLGAGRADEAIAAYLEAVRLRPDFAAAHHNLGVALGGRQRLDEAIEHARAAVRLEPADTNFRFNLGVFLQAKGLAAEAVDQYRRLIRNDPKALNAYVNLSSLLRGQGDAAGALEACREGAKLDASMASRPQCGGAAP